ncbi:hypothetical protein [Dyadobacter sp. MSC1_007]|jgi:hypothetical protein|uniref:hypothetical protein n=1 Tax=Dyadobacter sp. MSC1_007 TaxID=2909264 RepID=UPI00202FDE02|nr:hypothetical protein [Dyadobacter sp. MSC1_007]
MNEYFVNSFDADDHFDRDVTIKIIGTGVFLDILLFYSDETALLNELLGNTVRYELIKNIELPALQLHSSLSAVTKRINLVQSENSLQELVPWFESATNTIRIIAMDSSTCANRVMVSLSLSEEDVNWLKGVPRIKIDLPDPDLEQLDFDLVKNIRLLFRNLKK